MKVVIVRTIRWRSPRRKVKWRNLQRNGSSGAAVKEKSKTLNKSGKESSKRETELFMKVEVAVSDEEQEERDVIRDQLVEVQTRMKRMKQGASLKRCNATLTLPGVNVLRQNRKLNRNLWEYIDASDKERGQRRS